MTKFSPFNIATETYKTVNNQNIPIDIFLHKDLRAGKHPLIVRIHGGFLITGIRNYEEWFPAWILEYATAQSAILISPDYRLLPESKGVDLLEDLEDLWTWVHTKLPGVVASKMKYGEVDLDKVVVIGESGGGYLAIQLALSHAMGIRAVVAAYPMLGLQSPFWTTHYEKNILDTPMLPASMIDEHLDAMKPGEIVTGEERLGRRLQLAIATVQHGRFIEIFGDEPVLMPENRVQGGEMTPPLFLFHGTGDAVVPFSASENFVEMLTKRGAKVYFVSRPGGHGFDVQTRLHEDWIRKGMEFVTRELLAR